MFVAWERLRWQVVIAIINIINIINNNTIIMIMIIIVFILITKKKFGVSAIITLPVALCAGNALETLRCRPAQLPGVVCRVP